MNLVAWQDLIDIFYLEQRVPGIQVSNGGRARVVHSYLKGIFLNCIGTKAIGDLSIGVDPLALPDLRQYKSLARQVFALRRCTLKLSLTPSDLQVPS